MLADVIIPESAGVATLFALALGTGLLHALEADHVAAVTGLASSRSGWRPVVGASVRWALGHGAVLLAVSLPVYLLGAAIPEQMSAIAEAAVGVVLVAIGVVGLVRMSGLGAHVHLHLHDGLVPHAHWHRHVDPQPDHASAAHDHRHEPLLVGAVHGLAGSSPLLVLLPLGAMGSAGVAVAYVTVFSLGVVVSMAAVGGLIGTAFAAAARFGSRPALALRGVAAGSSALLGVLLLVGAA